MSVTALAVGSAGFGRYAVEKRGEHLSLEASNNEADHILCPGFVDIHIHGAFGIDFMSASAAEMAALCEHLAQEGYEAFLPTTVTSSPHAVISAIKSLPQNRMIQGFHLEGPFISRNHPGAQPKEYIADPRYLQDWEQVLGHAALRVITLAPEEPGADELIERLSNRGVIVSLGHTDATYNQAEAACNCGARHVTHTFNAMRGIHHREVGLVGFTLLSPRITAELIYDRLHVSPPAARLLVQSKGSEKVIAVSDSSMATGLAAGSEITMWGHRCLVGEEEVRLAENNALAGSAITLRTAFRNLVQDFGAEIAIRACSINPRQALGMALSPNRWILCDREGEIEEIWWAQLDSN